jgi:hypothetical protein
MNSLRCAVGLHSLQPLSDRVRVVDITQVKTGWIARGEILHVACCTRPSCSVVYEELVRSIPIECAAFPCPSCGSGSKLAPEVLTITHAGSGYDFVAQLKCDACSKRHPLSRLLEGLTKITKVKIGPTGVEVEVKH